MQPVTIIQARDGGALDWTGGGKHGLDSGHILRVRWAEFA